MSFKEVKKKEYGMNKKIQFPFSFSNKVKCNSQIFCMCNFRNPFENEQNSQNNYTLC